MLSINLNGNKSIRENKKQDSGKRQMDMNIGYKMLLQ